MRYSHIRVLTVRELNPGDILHSGQTGGSCMTWHILHTQHQSAIARVGGPRTGSLVELTGKEIREFEMYRADDCPYCHDASELPEPEIQRALYRTEQLNASHVLSSFVFHEARRFGIGQKPGGAFLRKGAK